MHKEDTYPPILIATEPVGRNSWLFREPDATPEMQSTCCRSVCSVSHTLQRHAPPTGSVTVYGYGCSQHPRTDEIGRIRQNYIHAAAADDAVKDAVSKARSELQNERHANS
jgi:hypothetical protein